MNKKHIKNLFYTIALLLFFPLYAGAATEMLQFGGMENGSITDDAFVSTTGTISAVSSTTHSGGYSFRSSPATTATGFGNTGPYGTTGLFAGGNTNVTGSSTAHVWFRQDQLPTASMERIFDFTTNAAVQSAFVAIDSTGALGVYDSLGVQIGATTTTVIAAATWTSITFDVNFADAGIFILKINDVQVANGTGDFINGSIDHFRIGKTVNTGGNSVNFYYDDWQWTTGDNTLNTAAVVATAIPNADGDLTGWTGGTGLSDYLEVDDFPGHDTSTYNASAAVDVSESYNVQDSGSMSIAINGTATIKAVVARNMVIRDGASNGTVQMLMRSGTTNATTTGAASSAVYVNQGILRETDPSTSAAWTISGIYGVEVGVTDNHATNRARVSAGHIDVLFVQGVVASATQRRMRLFEGFRIKLISGRLKVLQN
ncbi:MAG: hypothetical protein Q7R58_02515 [bacterium]|nr:hypothetical protein [bacterium]